MLIGNAPVILGPYGLDITEFLFCQDMPISLVGSTGVSIPDNLKFTAPLVNAVKADLHKNNIKLDGVYIYLTAKNTIVPANQEQARPGWHTDGFGSADLNYIWYDKIPTVFCAGELEVSDDHELSMLEMAQGCEGRELKTYPNHFLLKLDQTVIHRCGTSEKTEQRAFIKISVSKNKYNLQGNAKNYLLNYDWDMLPRNQTRNNPHKPE